MLERHPALDIAISHGGGATGYLYGRMASAARKRPWARAELREDGAFESLLQRAGFGSVQTWCDPKGWFAVCLASG